MLKHRPQDAKQQASEDEQYKNYQPNLIPIPALLKVHAPAKCGFIWTAHELSPCKLGKLIVDPRLLRRYTFRRREEVHEVILANVERWNTVARLLFACAIVLVDVDARRHVKADLSDTRKRMTAELYVGQRYFYEVNGAYGAHGAERAERIPSAPVVSC